MNAQTATATKFIDLLAPYVPAGCAEPLVAWLENHRAKLVITRKRTSKFGDYSPPVLHPWHRITVNHNLNPYSFLITLLHEMSHLLVWRNNRNRVSPHGTEWQKKFSGLILPYIESGTFPEDIKQALFSHLSSTTASCCTDPDLMRVLRKFNKPAQKLLIEDLKENEIFIYNKRRFQKGEKLRKNFRCLDVDSGRIYLFSPVAEVRKITVSPEPAIL